MQMRFSSLRASAVLYSLLRKSFPFDCGAYLKATINTSRTISSSASSSYSEHSVQSIVNVQSIVSVRPDRHLDSFIMSFRVGDLILLKPLHTITTINTTNNGTTMTAKPVTLKDCTRVSPHICTLDALEPVANAGTALPTSVGAPVMVVVPEVKVV